MRQVKVLQAREAGTEAWGARLEEHTAASRTAATGVSARAGCARRDTHRALGPVTL